MEDYEEAGEDILNPAAKGLIAASAFVDPDLERDEVSWLVVGIAPEQVVRELLGAKDFQRLDAESYQILLPDIDARIEIVGFDTDAGQTVEIRFPLSPTQIGDINRALAERNLTAGFDLNFVADIDDSAEEFVVQAIDSSGRLNRPRRIKLAF